MKLILILFVSTLSLTLAVQMRSFGNKEEIHDKEHIKQHLENKIDTDDIKLDAEQERFHYFAIHDLNKDNVIDGIELVKAISHSHEEYNQIMSDEDIEKLVDRVLLDYDENGDGFVSYAEYSVKNK